MGIISVKLPVLKPFFNKAKQVLTSGLSHSSKDPGGKSNSVHAGPNSHRLTHVERSGKQKTLHTLRSLDDSSDEQLGRDSKSIAGSQIDLVEKGAGPAVLVARGSHAEEGIQVTWTYDVSREESGV